MKSHPMLFSAPMVRAIMEGRKTETRRPVGPDDLKDRRYLVGDEIWVRETWRVRGGREYEYQKYKPSVVYRADAEIDPDQAYGISDEWRPSIFMPRWACRITLRVTGERIERLQEITEEGAVAEGIKRFTKDGDLIKYCVGDFGEPGNVPWADMPRSARDAYAALWDSINPKMPLRLNPWVRVIQFEKA